MTEPRRSWRGKGVAPRSPRAAWGAFARAMGLLLVFATAIAVIMLLVAEDQVTLNPQNRWNFLWIRVGAVVVGGPLVVYEVWLLWSRLAAFRRGEVFVDDDEVSPDDVPAPTGRKRRETPAQARRRKAFWRELVIVTAVWLFCTGLVGWVSLADWQAGRPLGDMGKLLLGLMVLYPVYVILSVYLKNEKDRGR